MEQSKCSLTEKWINKLWHIQGLEYSNKKNQTTKENLMDWGAWPATVHGVTKSRTWLSNFTFTKMPLHAWTPKNILNKEDRFRKPHTFIFTAFIWNSRKGDTLAIESISMILGARSGGGRWLQRSTRQLLGAKEKFCMFFLATWLAGPSFPDPGLNPQAEILCSQ